ncbi:hypothetical protein [Conexibacter sp. DBS9H8]|uniref:hypothetical protein n=1 Tax=Conexibacter sp. DBS9H8 TaxID=2937801 RepID=UPI00200E08EC|nr:hypothetical protein [Conexibacter sp. DBS9H8]
MSPGEVRVRAAHRSDLPALSTFRCSTGLAWEDTVEAQIRGPLPGRYLSSPPQFDGHLLVAVTAAEDVVAVGAHRIEPSFVPDVGYVEVVAVALHARGTVVALGDGEKGTLGEMMLLTIMLQMVDLGRHPSTFARIDRRNARSLALCDRVGLSDERPEPNDRTLVRRWGDLPY